MNLPPCCWLTCTASGVCAALGLCAGGGGATPAHPVSATTASSVRRGCRIGSAEHGFVVFAERRRGFRESRARAVERQRQTDEFEIAARPLLKDAERAHLRIGGNLVECMDGPVRDAGRFEAPCPFLARPRHEDFR